MDPKKIIAGDMSSKKLPSVTSGPKGFFKRRHSRSSSAGPSRSSSWSMHDMFKSSSAVENFAIEELAGKGGKLVFGPVSVFSGGVSVNVKSRIPDVTVSVTFRGLTEYNGRTLAFLNMTENLWTGDLEPGLRKFLFALKFPSVNLPPSSSEPFIAYTFIAQIRPSQRNSNNTPGAPASPTLADGNRTYTSKPHHVIFMPYFDPFAKPLRDGTKDIPKKISSEDLPLLSAAVVPLETPPLSPRGTGRPILRVTTDNLPPSPSLIPADAKSSTTSNPSTTKSATILDGTGKVLAKLRVTTIKSKFVPGDEIKVTVSVILPKGVPIPKTFSARVIERRTLGFETDEDAIAVEANFEALPGGGGGRSKKTSSGKLFSRTVASQKGTFSAHNAIHIENRPLTAGSGAGGAATKYHLEIGTEVTETVTIKLPTFKTFIDDSLLPTGSLPLGPSIKETSPVLVSPSLPTLSPALPSLKGKEPVRPPTGSRPKTGSTTINSSASITSVVNGLHYIVAHTLNITVPLFSGPASSLIRKTSGMLDVDLDLVVGNKTPDVYGYSSHSRNGSIEVLKVSTPELVVVPPGQVEEVGVGVGSGSGFGTGTVLGLGLGLRHSDSRGSFKREPSPLRNVNGAQQGEGRKANGSAGRSGNGSSSGGIGGSGNGSATTGPPIGIYVEKTGGDGAGVGGGGGGVIQGGYRHNKGPSSSRISFRSMYSLENGSKDPRWKKGERFPTLAETEDRPTFLAN